MKKGFYRFLPAVVAVFSFFIFATVDSVSISLLIAKGFLCIILFVCAIILYLQNKKHGKHARQA